MSCRVVSCRVVSCRVVPCRAVPCRAVPCRAVPCRAVPCRAVPCRVVSYYALYMTTIRRRFVEYQCFSCFVAATNDGMCATLLFHVSLTIWRDVHRDETDIWQGVHRDETDIWQGIHRDEASVCRTTTEVGRKNNVT